MRNTDNISRLNRCRCGKRSKNRLNLSERTSEEIRKTAVNISGLFYFSEESEKNKFYNDDENKKAILLAEELDYESIFNLPIKMFSRKMNAILSHAFDDRGMKLVRDSYNYHHCLAKADGGYCSLSNISILSASLHAVESGKQNSNRKRNMKPYVSSQKKAPRISKSMRQEDALLVFCLLNSSPYLLERNFVFLTNRISKEIEKRTGVLPELKISMSQDRKNIAKVYGLLAA